MLIIHPAAFAVGRGPDRRDLRRRLHPAVSRQRRHRPPHPRPERHPARRRPEGGPARPRPAAVRPVLRLARPRRHRRPRPLLVHRPAGRRRHHLAARRHPLARDRRHHHHRDRLGRARRLGRPSRRGWVDKLVQFVSDPRLRDPRLPDRALPRAGLRDQPGLVQADRLHPVHRLVHRLARARSRCRSSPSPSAASPASPAGARLGDRRTAPGLRPDAAQPRPQLRTASSTSTCCATPAARRSPSWRCSSSACSAAPSSSSRSSPSRARVSSPSPRPQGDIPVVMGVVVVTADHRRRRQPPHRPRAGWLNPKVRLS